MLDKHARWLAASLAPSFSVWARSRVRVGGRGEEMAFELMMQSGTKKVVGDVSKRKTN